MLQRLKNMKLKWRRSMKSRKTSGWSKIRKPQKVFLLLLVLMSVLSVLTGCQTGSDVSEDYKSIVIGMVPELPEHPELPALSWQYQDGRYSISASDADLFLDYGENQIPLYLHQMEVYKEKLSILLGALK